MDNKNLEDLKKMLTPNKPNGATFFGCLIILATIFAFAVCCGAFYGVAIRVARWVSGS